MIDMNHLIKKRFSPRAFAKKIIDAENIELLFRAAGKAPSAMNEQPWYFIYATKESKNEYEKLFSLLNSWNQKWAQSAPVLILAIAKMTYNYKNKPNDYAIYDLGQAVSYLTFQATELDLYVHQIGGFDSDKAIETLKIPKDFKPITMMALGYQGDLSRIPISYHEAEKEKRTRKSINSFVFRGQWK